MTITDQEKVTLYQLLAKATGAEQGFGYDYLDTLILIGEGMFWSRTFYKRARWLAEDIKEETKGLTPPPSGD